MSLPSLKPYLPRGLYGRAALILMAPAVVLQLIVSVHFIQNHLEDATRQMTDLTIGKLDLVFAPTLTATDRAAALAAMAPILPAVRMNVAFADPAEVPPRDRVLWYDYSAHVVRREIRAKVPDTLAVIFPDDRNVQLFLDSEMGPLEIRFSRRLVTLSTPHQLIVTMVFFGALMTVIAYLYLRNQLRPITRLADAAQAFGRGRSVPYHPRGATEVRAAGRAFLDMRARIERHIEQRTLMLSGVSHDLRTPLTRLKLGLAMLDDDEAEPLLRDVAEMEHLITLFLDFSRGAADDAAEEVDAAALVAQVVEDAQRGGTDVRLGPVDCTGPVMLRPVAVRRALENLVGNAVRYGHRAEVSLERVGANLRFRVEDDGPGIPADRRDAAMRAFVRLDPARNQNRGGGVGLGLAIATDVARAHGGTLRLGDSARMGGLCADLLIGV